MEHQKCLSGTRLADTPDRTRARQLLPNGQKWKQAVGKMAGSKFCNTTINFYVKEIEEDQPLLCVRRRSLAADKNENNRSSHSRADKNCSWTCLLERRDTKKASLYSDPFRQKGVCRKVTGSRRKEALCPWLFRLVVSVVDLRHKAAILRWSFAAISRGPRPAVAQRLVERLPACCSSTCFRPLHKDGAQWTQSLSPR
ncbi:hypothetical protein C0Q70_15621 [Pomacea canaliculata]|uniref:Uncharacterized protein n=1 Tax=Pomacea canaliculata TaxID=400727 RepID=A0A2T7NVD1_POMCA|nr:hypothetical protein C0Q70_15621 [Pomacea canaliculata]